MESLGQQLLLFFSLSLFDSLSTTTQIVIFVLLLTTDKPVKNALAYLAGLSAAYFLCGIAGLAALSQVNDLVKRITPSSAGIPNDLYYQAQVLTGAILAAAGLIYYRRKIKSNKPPVEHLFLARFKRINPWIAAGIGALVSSTSFPMALPYVFALNRLAGLHLGAAGAAIWIAFYNFGYALPMAVIFGVYLAMEKNAESLGGDLHKAVRLLNLRLTAGMISGIGLLILADAAAYFVLGHPLMKGRYF